MNKCNLLTIKRLQVYNYFLSIQLGLSRYETAFQILHKLRAGMVRPDQDRIGGYDFMTSTTPVALSGGRRTFNR